ncbi:TPA: DUF4435 domain-containing protein [Serratia marcescens]
MNSNFYQLPDEVVTEIKMSHHKRPWLILEGSTDALFFSTRKLSNSPVTMVAYGWENVRYIIDRVLQEGIDAHVLGFIDRDYREDLGIIINDSHIVVTDYRDLEVSMFESDALDRVTVEFGSQQKLPKRECGSVAQENIRKKIYSVAQKMGRLRYYSLVHGLHYPIKNIEYTKFVDERTLEIDESKLVQQINSKSQTKIDLSTLRQAFDSDIPERLRDEKNISSGHDIMELLGLSLKKLWGTNNSGAISRERLESCFRIGYSDDYFTQTNMFKLLEQKLAHA